MSAAQFKQYRSKEQAVHDRERISQLLQSGACAKEIAFTIGVTPSMANKIITEQLGWRRVLLSPEEQKHMQARRGPPTKQPV